MDIILGSSSAPRKELLKQLKIPFKVVIPDINEEKKGKESPHEHVYRLAQEKAIAVEQKCKQHSFIITGDQILLCDDIIFGKPLTLEKSQKQLQYFSGKEAVFHSSLCLLNTKTNTFQTKVIATRIKFRSLSLEKIRRYAETELPLNCAGSFKAEGLGAALIKNIKSDDPYAIKGLPLLTLCSMLDREGFDVIMQ